MALMPRNEALRRESGEVDSADPYVDFLYTLMRDEIPPGRLEAIVTEMEEHAESGNTEFTNGWLARYAKNLSKRILDTKGD